MYTINKEKAHEILLNQGFKTHEIDSLLNRYPPIHDKLSRIIEQWINDQTISEITIDGISLNQVIKIRRCHFLIAIRDLNKLLDPDLTLEKRNQWHRILTSPVHFE